ncbi:MAG: DUF4097 family beta strand repeat protein [Candidatus Aminicenantes bacterium]|nr:MAG: DUF4097 family beta strand repeat protein [Candidatus Aminicenantes bacterium]
MKYTTVFLLLLSMLFFSSCFYIRVEYPPERGKTPVDEFRKNVPLSPGGTLSLASVNGNVEIHGWEREELEVYAEKMIQLPDRTKFYVYPRKNFAPGIVFDKFENFVKIRTKNVSENREFGFVDYFIDVPHSIHLKDIVVRNGDIHISEVYGDAYLDLTEGEITVENFSGSLTASTNRGSVYANLFDLREQDEIVITSREGNITLSLQEKASAHLVAAFPEGEINSEFEIDIPADEKKIDTQWGKNGPRISLTALRGNIRIEKVTRY